MKLSITKQKIWQIGSGDSSRDYSQIFLDFGVALVGPGNPGDERKSETKLFYQENPDKNWGAVISRIKKGDWVILRGGQKIVKAVGEAISDYEFNEIFGDVDGWDLQHLIEVKWYMPEKEIVFEKSILVRSTLTRCYDTTVINRINSEEFVMCRTIANYKEFKVPKLIDFEEISQSLIDFGLRIQDSENITQTIQRIKKLTMWYFEKDKNVLEHEIRTFLVIPLLISLGWSEQKIKIEYHKIDIAIFNNSFTGDYKTSPLIIIETKRFDDGLSFTSQQALNYSKDYPNCKKIITTNGYRYKIYEKQKDDFVETAYLNMFNLREHCYLNPNIEGAIFALLKISNLN